MQAHEISLTKYLWFPVNREGWPFVALFAVVALLLGQLWAPLGWLGVILTCWCAWFFRDPDRVTPVRDGLVVSPADGVVQLLGLAPPPKELEMGDEPRMCISVFMSVFSVHINRVPVAGTVAMAGRDRTVSWHEEMRRDASVGQGLLRNLHLVG